jgi:hypothetical protein
MEENTVLLSLKKYDELVEAYSKVDEPKKHTVVIKNSMFEAYEAKTDDEGVKLLADDLKQTKLELAEAKKELEKLPKETSIEDIKKMSPREFKKWKRE